MRIILFILFSVTASSFMTSCANLKHIGKYATSSVENLEEWDKIDYSFVAACKHDCLIDQLEALKMSDTCNCKMEAIADSVNTMLFSSILGYMQGLALLSDPSLTQYDFEQLQSSIPVGLYGFVNITENTSAAYSQLAATITAFITNSIRKKKLSLYISQANEPVKSVISALQTNISQSLTGMIGTTETRLRSYYFDLVNDRQASTFERKFALEDYLKQKDALSAKREQLLVFTNLLEEVKQSHQKLYESRNELSSNDVRKSIFEFLGTYKSLRNQFKQIKTLP